MGSPPSALTSRGALPVFALLTCADGGVVSYRICLLPEQRHLGEKTQRTISTPDLFASADGGITYDCIEADAAYRHLPKQMQSAFPLLLCGNSCKAFVGL